MLATDRLSVFANGSLLSDNFFDADELGEENDALTVSVNAPRFKVRGGFSYVDPDGLSLNGAARYVDEFRVEDGPYNGTVPAYFLLDLGGGYDLGRFAPGLRVDVSVNNVLGNDHIQYVGAPRLGRLALARLTYAFGGRR